jgi:DNA recombination protein RmuC
MMLLAVVMQMQSAVLYMSLGMLAVASVALGVWRDAIARELERERQEATSRRDQAVQLERELAVARERMRTLEETLVGEGQRADALKSQMADLFAQIGDKQIERGTEQLVQLAGERFEAQQADVLAPFSERLLSLDQKLNEMEIRREGAYVKVVEQVSALAQAAEQLRAGADGLHAETLKLSSSMRHSGARGRWGEFQLRRVVEVAGMSDYCDFSVQLAGREDQGLGRPDMTVRIPNGQKIPVDAKTPLTHYLDACDATDEGVRAAALAAHSRAVLTYANELAKRDYTCFDAMSDFVVMFVPNEAALSAALIAESDLLDKAIARGVYIVGPLSLVALLRAYAAGWIVVRQEQNAREIAQTGRELYKRLAIFADHLGRVGTGLRNATAAFNSAVGSYRDRLVPQARRFEDLGANEASKVVPELAEADSLAISMSPAESISTAEAVPA